MSHDELRSAVLGLPREQRAELAHTLLLSLHEDADVDTAAAWVAEIERRAREVANGEAQLVDWDDVRERIAARLKARREDPATR
ncbi:MAG: addiction module protein [Deltaproteobacteria bacterium]|nr:addiction module protein [Deltaproteobacteria bacterium]